VIEDLTIPKADSARTGGNEDQAGRKKIVEQLIAGAEREERFLKEKTSRDGGKTAAPTDADKTDRNRPVNLHQRSKEGLREGRNF